MPRVAEPEVDFMLDLETLGNTSNSVIVQIGAVVFDRKSGNIISDFKINVDPESAIQRGLEMTTSTVMWWLSQAKEAQDSITKQGEPLFKALSLFRDWVAHHCPNPKKARVWCHSSFDFPLINNAFDKCRIEQPWAFYCSRDLRTIVDLSGVNIYTMKRDGTYHDALDDCMHQVKYVIRCMKALNL